MDEINEVCRNLGVVDDAVPDGGVLQQVVEDRHDEEHLGGGGGGVGLCWNEKAG